MLLPILLSSMFIFSSPDSSLPKLAGLFEVPSKERSLLRLEAIQDSLLSAAKLTNKEWLKIDQKKNSDLLFLKMKHGRKEHFDVSILDTDGNEIMHESMDYDPSNHLYKFDVHSVVPGFYIFKIYSNKTMFLRDFHLKRDR